LITGDKRAGPRTAGVSMFGHKPIDSAQLDDVVAAIRRRRSA